MGSKFTTVDLKGGEHTVRLCTDTDVPKHFKVVKHLVPKDGQEEYLKHMYECVESSSAFCIDDRCFIYLKHINSKVTHCYSLFSKGSPLKALTLFVCILCQVRKSLVILKFSPYRITDLEQYSSLLIPKRTRRPYNLDKPITIRCDNLRLKLKSLYESKGISWVR